MPPLVSVIIPCYNAEPWLEATLRSALGQTWPHTEIILVDGGSSDGSFAVARRFEARGVRIESAGHRGASAARNQGMRIARGEFIQFLDADDVLAPEKIERQMARLAAAPSGAIASGAWARFFTSPSEAVFSPEPAWGDLTGIEFLLLHYKGGWMMPPLAWLTPRALADAAGPWREDLSLNDDGEYFCRVLLASAGIVFCADARSFYRSGLPGSLSQRTDRRALQSLWLSTRLNCDRLLAACGDSPECRPAVASGWQRLALDCYPVAPDLANEAEARCQALGGSPYPLPVTDGFRRVAAILGWRAAKRLQSWYRKAKA
jgi:glycosyltransferase involved in cell wall biosynthesis